MNGTSIVHCGRRQPSGKTLELRILRKYCMPVRAIVFIYVRHAKPVFRIASEVRRDGGMGMHDYDDLVFVRIERP
jgi:hypothetical protein